VRFDRSRAQSFAFETCERQTFRIYTTHTNDDVRVCYHHNVNNAIDIVKGGNMTPNDLARELNVSPKTLRAYLRKAHTRDVNAKNTSWAIDAKCARDVRKHFARATNDA